MKERIEQIAVVLRVDTDRRRFECTIPVPDGSPHHETTFLIHQALGSFPGPEWHEVSR